MKFLLITIFLATGQGSVQPFQTHAECVAFKQSLEVVSDLISLATGQPGTVSFCVQELEPAKVQQK
jgi:hypothetical protein